MKKRTNSRGTPTSSGDALLDTSFSSAGDAERDHPAYKSGAASAPATPTKRRDGSDGSVSSAGARRKRKDEIAQTFVIVNERPVDDISLDFFYKPHTITLLAVSVLAVMYFAFVRWVDEPMSPQGNPFVITNEGYSILNTTQLHCELAIGSLVFISILELCLCQLR